MKTRLMKFVFFALLMCMGLSVQAQKFKSVGKSHEGLTIVQKYDKKKKVHLYGYVNKKNKLVIPMNFSYAGNFSNGMAIVGKSKKYGLINKWGRIITPIQYDEIKRVEHTPGLFITETKGLYGLVGNDGVEIYPPMFEKITFSDDCKLAYLISGEDEFGCYDFEHQEELLPPRCKGRLVDSVVMYEGKCRFWGKYGADQRFYDTIIAVKPFLRHTNYMLYPDGGYIVKSNEKYGLLQILPTGELEAVLPMEYDAIELEWKGEDGHNSLIHCMKDGKWGVYDEKGITDLVSDTKMEEDVEKNGWVLMGQRHGKYGIYKSNHRTRFDYDERPVKWGYKWLVKCDGKYGIENNDDKEYIELPAMYDTIMINAGDDLLAITKKDDEVEMVYYNPYGKHCVGPFDWPYDHVQYCGKPSEYGSNACIYAVLKDGKWGFIRIENEQEQVEVVEICKPQYDRIASFDSNGEMLVKKGKKTFYIDSNGKKLKRKIYFIKD